MKATSTQNIISTDASCEYPGETKAPDRDRFGPFNVHPTPLKHHVRIKELLTALFPRDVHGKLPRAVISRIRYTLCPGCTLEPTVIDDDDGFFVGMNECELCQKPYCVDCGRGCQCKWRYSDKAYEAAKKIAAFMINSFMYRRSDGEYLQCQHSNPWWSCVQDRCSKYVPKKIHDRIADIEPSTVPFTCMEHTCICLTDEKYWDKHFKSCIECGFDFCPVCNRGCRCGNDCCF